MNRLVLLLWLLGLSCLVQGHEVRPASMEIRQLPAQGLLEFRWRQPINGEYTIAISPVLSSGWLDREPDRRLATANSLIEIWTVESSLDALAGQQLWISGLDRTITDALVRIDYPDGGRWHHLIKADDPRVTLLERGGAGAAIPEYLQLGLTHIWEGPDHLVYVLGLILLIASLRSLVMTITAFTLAHSITLACAVLGLVQLRPAPVEAVISLSIVYVAVELVRARQGRPSLASRAPWVIAFAFGLLHGFGFAGALQEIGLPDGAVAAALLLFNIGIEIGQLLFIALTLSLLWSLRRMWPWLHARLTGALPWGIGAVASFWLVERLVVLT